MKEKEEEKKEEEGKLNLKMKTSASLACVHGNGGCSLGNKEGTLVSPPSPDEMPEAQARQLIVISGS